MLIERTCRKCKKLFIPAPEHIYEDTKGIYCSWTCFNHRNDRKKRIVSDKRCKKVEQLTLKGEVIRTFESASAAAKHIDCSANGLCVACRRKTPYKGYLWRYVDELPKM